MNILVIGPDDRHMWTFVHWSLIDMGHTSDLIDPRYGLDRIPDKLLYNKYDLIMCSRTPSLYNVLKDTDVPVVCWNCDTRGSTEAYRNEFGNDLVELFKRADVLYTVARGEVGVFNEAGCNAKWLIQGIYPDTDNKFGEREYKYDVSFLGGIDYIHDGRVDLLRAIDKKFDLNTERAFEKKASKVYYNTKINLGNAHSADLGENSVRDQKICGSGGFLLTSWYDGIDEVWPEGTIEIYKSQDECLDKIEYYLEHEEEREAIADKGYEEVHANQKYSDRLQCILKDF